MLSPSLAYLRFPHSKTHGTQALTSTWLFYEAQISGRKPSWSRANFRGDSHLDDLVPGGWHDAGDFLKLNFPMGISVSFLAWSALDFPGAFDLTASVTPALNNVRLAAQYLMDCHVGGGQYVGQIGAPAIDHAYWGRPEEQETRRPAYVWLESMPASDLLGAVSAALASSHLLFQGRDTIFAAGLLSHAEELYAWAKSRPGTYSTAYPSATKIYPSSRYLDKLMYAAAWLFRATGDGAYAADAYAFWNATGSSKDIFPSWDSTHAPAVNLLLKLASQGANVPGQAEYERWYNGTFQAAWLDARGKPVMHGDGTLGPGSRPYGCPMQSLRSRSITRTPQGLVYPTWSSWGTLSCSTNAAFMMALRASYSPVDRERALAFVRSQLDYALGSTGRSFVVGLGRDPPTQAHHAAASCPDLPEECGWTQFDSVEGNPQVLTGALVGGPPSGDGSFLDVRSDYRSNEVAVSYNAGFTGALAGAIALA